MSVSYTSAVFDTVVLKVYVPVDDTVATVSVVEYVSALVSVLLVQLK